MEMIRIDVTRTPVSAALCLSLIAGLLSAAGCSDTATGQRTDSPEMKAYMQKRVESFKAKTQEAKAKKGNAAASRPR